MRILLTISLSALSILAMAQETVQWMSWNEAVAAREKFIKENKAAIDQQKMMPKKFFIDVYTDWCGWCKKMDATTFKDPNIVKYLNTHYYPVKLDAEMSDTIIYNNHKFFKVKQGKRGTHTLAASLLDYKLSYPTYVIMDENVQRATILPGYKNAEDLLGVLIFFKSNEYIRYKQYLEQMQKQAEAREAAQAKP